MKVIFVKDVPKVGKKNEIKEVSTGYGNFLVSSGACILATKEALQKINDINSHKESLKQKTKEEFKALADSLSNTVLTITAKSRDGKHLFGSVTEEDIKREIKKTTNIDINPKSLRLKTPIKEIGRYTISIDEGTMHAEVQLVVDEK
jgi:large subunit ribosomal protein L9